MDPMEVRNVCSKYEQCRFERGESRSWVKLYICKIWTFVVKCNIYFYTFVIECLYEKLSKVPLRKENVLKNQIYCFYLYLFLNMIYISIIFYF